MSSNAAMQDDRERTLHGVATAKGMIATGYMIRWMLSKDVRKYN